ncbi:PREDICTED: uncharacterized protein LOC106810726 isoform X2 [Priapulus caudatus]|uniref:Uncharacterized protein LOC106810726 isoform X2 n=1 Tax=Priapulus caudatus TaxID=37621 RepID=A0ABM1EBS9_PRICU|nr:PREDICTED: uncharacterized protein LOC106810726 isoform X2 [Priapulus caudatus]
MPTLCAVYNCGKPAKLYDKTNPDWAPTQKLGHDKIRTITHLAVSRRDRSNERYAKKAKLEAAEVLVTLNAVEFSDSVLSDLPDPNNENIPEKHREVGCQTELTGLQISELEQCNRDMTCELVEMKKKILEADLTEASFKNNDEKTKFYTGLTNFLVLQQIMSMCGGFIHSGTVNSLTKFQELLLVLIRLRLNVPFQDLGYRFGVSRSTACRIFDKWIDVLSVRLEFLIVWPDRELLRKTMPNVFKQNFGERVSVIIDCFEVFINRPSGLMPRAITWSNYKHHNTVKFLIGITPQGVISFISKAWGGRVSDKHLTENCGMLQKLTPGDIVLADRGFDIADSVGLYRASLKIPAFTRGKKQLSAIEVEETRKIANVRIHVERVIGLVRRKYVILQSILTIDTITAKAGESVSPIDKIAKVCCALCNFLTSIVRI